MVVSSPSWHILFIIGLSIFYGAVAVQRGKLMRRERKQPRPRPASKPESKPQHDYEVGAKADVTPPPNEAKRNASVAAEQPTSTKFMAGIAHTKTGLANPAEQQQGMRDKLQHSNALRNLLDSKLSHLLRTASATILQNLSHNEPSGVSLLAVAPGQVPAQAAAPVAGAVPAAPAAATAAPLAVTAAPVAATAAPVAATLAPGATAAPVAAAAPAPAARKDDSTGIGSFLIVIIIFVILIVAASILGIRWKMNTGEAPGRLAKEERQSMFNEQGSQFWKSAKARQSFRKSQMHTGDDSDDQLSDAGSGSGRRSSSVGRSTGRRTSNSKGSGERSPRGGTESISLGTSGNSLKVPGGDASTSASAYRDRSPRAPSADKKPREQRRKSGTGEADNSGDAQQSGGYGEVHRGRRDRLQRGDQKSPRRSPPDAAAVRMDV